MGSGKYEKVGSPKDVAFTDPTGLYRKTMAQFGWANDPNAAMQFFLQNASQLNNLVYGPTSQLQQQLNAVAAQQAREGTQAALAALPYARQSSAASRAVSQAAAAPYAQAQAQTQQALLGLTGDLYARAMQNYAAQQLQTLQALAALAGQTGGLWSPTYEYRKGFWDYTGDILSPVLQAVAAYYLKKV